MIGVPVISFGCSIPIKWSIVGATSLKALPCIGSASRPTPLINVLGEWFEKNNKTQLRISETEKYAHVTFFFSGGRESEFKGETRELIPSPQVATYDLQPEMNSEMLTDKLVEAIKSGKYDAIICNY